MRFRSVQKLQSTDIGGLTPSARRAFDILYGNYKRTKIATMFGDSPLTNTAVAAHQHKNTMY